jgi:hypothetical protein
MFSSIDNRHYICLQDKEYGLIIVSREGFSGLIIQIS